METFYIYGYANSFQIYKHVCYSSCILLVYVMERERLSLVKTTIIYHFTYMRGNVFNVINIQNFVSQSIFK